MNSALAASVAQPDARRVFADGRTGALRRLDAPRDCPRHGPMGLDHQYVGGRGYEYVRVCWPCRRAENGVSA